MYRNKLAVFLLTVSILFTYSCSKKIDSKFVGKYIDQQDPRGIITLAENGRCDVQAAAGPLRDFWVVMDGAKAQLELVSDESPAHGSYYADFSGRNASFIIDNDTIITPSGRRFVKAK